MKPEKTSSDLIKEISSLLAGKAESEQTAIETCSNILSQYYQITIEAANKILIIWAEIIYQRGINEI